MIREALVTVLCAPVLVAQALSLRRRALRLQEADGPRTGRIGTGPPLRLLILGDSSAAGVGAQTQDAALAGQLTSALAAHHSVAWRLIARTGITTAETLAEARQSPPPPHDVAVIVLGVNDVTHLARQRQWLRDHADLRALLRNAGAKRLYISQVPPLGAFPLLPHPLRWLLGQRAIRFDAALAGALRTAPDTRYIPLPDTLDPADMAEDGFHPGPVIYAAWAQEIARQILSERAI
ncbi:SGNH/GDSL hydrolase family protein [Sulfitobacter albidus]|uniref:SGNH/GDSL hydrolase family protein n=1 Tax=Sulfitobacter albidus TaxID=2829501 RepID=A0A975JC01_9RHOB|nr:SGNH/GDSL hydrolase family protein [Sulfitobacter albidus]QUJ75476.1 SGNH/GDSL hydrolase family protein [Sulfitobacter albidus]